jgi:hypothetical protein
VDVSSLPSVACCSNFGSLPPARRFFFKLQAARDVVVVVSVLVFVVLRSVLVVIGLDSVGWDPVGWDSVGWDSVGWDSVGLDSVGLGSVGLGSVGLGFGAVGSGLGTVGLGFGAGGGLAGGPASGFGNGLQPDFLLQPILVPHASGISVKGLKTARGSIVEKFEAPQALLIHYKS